MIPKMEPEKEELVGGRVPTYKLGEDELKYIEKNLEKTGGAFSLSNDGFKELMNYGGKGSLNTAVGRANDIARIKEFPFRFRPKKDGRVAIVRYVPKARKAKVPEVATTTTTAPKRKRK